MAQATKIHGCLCHSKPLASLWPPLHPMAVVPTVVSMLGGGGVSPVGCHWDTAVPHLLGKLVTLGAICLGWSGWGVPMGAESWAPSPTEVTFQVMEPTSR